MEAPGIEPGSENLAEGNSTIIAGYLNFPSRKASRHDLRSGSFIKSSAAAKLRRRECLAWSAPGSEPASGLSPTAALVTQLVTDKSCQLFLVRFL